MNSIRRAITKYVNVIVGAVMCRVPNFGLSRLDDCGTEGTINRGRDQAGGWISEFHECLTDERKYKGLTEEERGRLSKHWEQSLGTTEEITFKVNWERLKDRIHVEHTTDSVKLKIDEKAHGT